MKKILSILLAVSMIATAAFAANATVIAVGSGEFDVSNGMALGTKTGYLKLDLSGAGDMAGATVNISDFKEPPAFGIANLWFKPIDALTVTVIGAGVNVGYDLLNSGSDYTKYTDGGALGLSFTVDPVALDVILPAGKIGTGLTVQGAFTTDIGAVAVRYAGSKSFQNHAIYGELKSDTLVDGLSLNLAGGVVLDNGKKAVIKLHPYAGFAIDAISCGAQVDIKIDNNKTSDTTAIGLAFTAGYDLDEKNSLSATVAYDLFDKFGDNDDPTKHTENKYVEVDFTQAIGFGFGSSWTAGLKIDLANGTNISIPFGVTLVY